ncbi:unnamed protein product [Orchesella dallaii]|uniref:Gustatory receptor n=1 Tax=Orchesella dallaii TaxID=48710 RepID=A0ABP1Q9Y3_9HEXA
MLSPLQITAFKLHKLGFWYMCPLPIVWNSDYTRLIFSKRSFTWALNTFSFVILLLLNVLMVLANFYNVVSYMIIPEQRKDYSVGISCLHFNAGLMMGDIVVAILLLYKNTSTVPGINEFLRWHGRLSRTFDRRDQTDLFDIFMILMVVVVWGVPWVILFCTLYFNLDPIYYFLQDFLMTDPLYRSLAEIVCSFGLRTFFMLGGFECARSLCFGAFILLVVCNRMEKSASLLITAIETNGCQRVLKYYKEFILVYRMYKPMLIDVLSLAVSTVFWILIAQFWVIIKGYETVPLFMYLLTSALGGSFLCVYVCTMHVVTQLGEHCEEVVVKCRKESSSEYSQLGTKQVRREKLALRKEAIALHPVTITYKPFQKIDRELLIALFHNEVNRLVDALCIFG